MRLNLFIIYQALKFLVFLETNCHFPRSLVVSNCVWKPEVSGLNPSATYALSLSVCEADESGRKDLK